MKRGLIFVYGVLSYAFFLATFLYAIGFIGNFGVPKSMDSAPTHPLIASLLIDLGLLTLFAVQHSSMARPAFKRWLTRYIPTQSVRSTYVLLSTACLVLLFWLWAPLGGVVWYVWLGIFWFTPTMSETHLVFAVFASLYIFVGIHFEERDLEDAHPEYSQYKRKTTRNGSALIPSLSRRLSRKSQAQTA